MNSNKMKRRSGLTIMMKLIGLIKPLVPIMLLAVILGVVGFLCAIFLTILAGYQLLAWVLIELGAEVNIETAGVLLGSPAETIFLVLIAMAIMRGVFRYGEQYCNHFIAFKLLAIIRNKVFASLRRLCPAKLEGRDKGNLISIITTDIELLEVFYAHTISPVFIAIITSTIMLCFIGTFSVWTLLFAAIAYLVIGGVIPIIYGKRGADNGMEFRNKFGELNSFVLESLRGVDEIIQYGRGKKQLEFIKNKSDELTEKQEALNRIEMEQKSMTTGMILFFSFGMFFLGVYLKQNGIMSSGEVAIATITMMGSFGPVVALANLSNNLSQTLASGERVLTLLEETPEVEEIEGKEEVKVGEDITVQNLGFAYDEDEILKSYSMDIPRGKIVGIHGASGSGKSTILKLLMRFWEAQQGKIIFGENEIKNINTCDLRKIESYVTQETHLFQDTIANNIGMSKLGATQDEIISAAKKASIHEFIMSLPNGYETKVGELGDTLSGGEKQRIGMARAFLHDAEIMLLDEPTSNLDSMNEAIILKSLQESCDEKTVVLVSHRKSTMGVADIVVQK